VKDLYSIGEVSKIMGISIQTLRYYSAIELLKPKYTNPTTRYRYYSADQLHFIDRIKYLQKFGMSLNEIRDILVNDDIPKLVDYLEQREKACTDEISNLQDTIDSIAWYKNYFTYVDDENSSKLAYTRHFDRRYMVATRVINGEPKEDFHIRLNVLRNSDRLKDLKYMRQFSYVLDYETLLEAKLEPHYLGMFIKEPPTFHSDDILEIQGGDFFCFKARILSEGWNPYVARMFFEGKKSKPGRVFACEYENDLHEYSHCVYEIQIRISGKEIE